jgi:hypothetical protein
LASTIVSVEPLERIANLAGPRRDHRSEAEGLRLEETASAGFQKTALKSLANPT